MSTVLEILNHALKIMKALQLQEIVCVFDQALYAKASEVVWKHSERFTQVVLMMGGFHTICNLLSIIGIRFGDAGLRDLAVESGVIAEGSIDNVLQGKQYARGVRLHKITYEALMRLAWQSFSTYLQDNQPDDIPAVNDTTRLLQLLCDNTNQEQQEAILQHPSFIKASQLFQEHLDRLRSSSGQLASFWMSCIDIMEIMLGLLRASREGNWNMYLHFIRCMIPWCFAYDRQNYFPSITSR